MGASVKGGRETYPVYCFCVWNAVVHVPSGGDFKRMVMLPLTGECNMVTSESEVMGGGNWPFECGIWKRRFKTHARMLEKALDFCCCKLAPQ